jgi:hypothetical protein
MNPFGAVASSSGVLPHMPRVFSYRRLPLVAVAALAAIAAATPRAPAQSREGSEIHRVLVIPINLQGRAPIFIDRDQIAQALYGADNSVASRYRAISYGKLRFSGSARDIADAVTLALPADFCNSGRQRLADDAEKEARSSGTDLSSYQHVVFVLPKDAPCWWTGLADIGGNRVWVKATTAKALQHELGHNLGMDHAVNWKNTEAEGSDFMGSGAASLNAPHVVQMGWLQDFPAKVIELTKAGDVTLEALESDPRQSRLPKVAIVRPTPGANTYYLSYRAASATNPLPGDFTRGLNIHIFDQAQQTGGLTHFVTSLTDGASYTDGPMSVRQISHSEGTRVVFHIDFSGTGQAIPAGPPPAPPGTLQSVASGKCLDLPGGVTRDGTAPIQYDCHGGPNQQWSVDAAGDAGARIVSRMSGKCLGADPNNPAPGGVIVQSPCGAAPRQLWVLSNAENGATLRNAATLLCLDVPGASNANGTKPVLWTCNGGNNQTWRYAAPAIE